MPALAGGVLVVWLQGGPAPALLHHFSGYLGLLSQFGQPMVHLPAPGSFLWPQLPLAVPAGLLAASLNTRRPGMVAPEFEADPEGWNERERAERDADR